MLRPVKSVLVGIVAWAANWLKITSSVKDSRNEVVGEIAFCDEVSRGKINRANYKRGRCATQSRVIFITATRSPDFVML